MWVTKDADSKRAQLAYIAFSRHIDFPTRVFWHNKEQELSSIQTHSKKMYSAKNKEHEFNAMPI